jgi:hypothetical protein
MVGFADLQIDSIYLREERYDFNLGDLKLNISGAASSEVIVYAEKPLIENKDDKIIFNVGESALSGGATTAELLKNMPLINNDPNGKILLKGKEPRILIDDKPTDLNAQQLQDLLESLPGNSIDKIEVMTNPPPQYATETGGVINIVTKKGKIGWVGRVNVSAGTRGESSTYANGSYRNQKLVLNLNGGVGVSTMVIPKEKIFIKILPIILIHKTSIPIFHRGLIFERRPIMNLTNSISFRLRISSIQIHLIITLLLHIPISTTSSKFTG